MQKFNLVLFLTCFFFLNASAQQLVTKVPITSSMVIKYSGENFSKNISLKKIDSYGFIKNDFLKALKIDSLTSLQNTGIDLEKDSYQYISIEDSVLSFVTLL